jgi:hypothetical protein
MKKIIFLAIFLLFPIISYAQPSIAFDSETYDFGPVERGSELKHTFIVSNEGNEELYIKGLVSSWGCTAVMASSSHLNPGEKGKITAKINTSGKRGLLYKSVQVESSDPKRPKVILNLKALIKEW